LASELVGPRGKVFAFEPLPRNIYYLKEHLRLNQCDNVEVIEAAVAEDNGFTYFEEVPKGYTSHISRNGCLNVREIGLDKLVLNNKLPPPDYMKM
jgi:FkbM family methyltransferase